MATVAGETDSPALRWTLWTLCVVVWTLTLVTTQPAHVLREVLPAPATQPVAKSGHLVAYAFLTILSAWLHVRRDRRWLLLVFLSLHGMATEFVQTFVPDRTGSWRDVGIDALQQLPLDPELRVFARSASDDKAPIMMILTAVDVLRAQQKSPAINIKVLLDPEEEMSSPSLAGMIERDRAAFAADALVILNHRDRRTGITKEFIAVGDYVDLVARQTAFESVRLTLMTLVPPWVAIAVASVCSAVDSRVKSVRMYVGTPVRRNKQAWTSGWKVLYPVCAHVVELSAVPFVASQVSPPSVTKMTRSLRHLDLGSIATTPASVVTVALT